MQSSATSCPRLLAEQGRGPGPRALCQTTPKHRTSCRAACRPDRQNIIDRASWRSAHEEPVASRGRVSSPTTGPTRRRAEVQPCLARECANLPAIGSNCRWNRRRRAPSRVGASSWFAPFRASKSPNRSPYDSRSGAPASQPGCPRFNFFRQMREVPLKTTSLCSSIRWRRFLMRRRRPTPTLSPVKPQRTPRCSRALESSRFRVGAPAAIPKRTRALARVGGSCRQAQRTVAIS